MSYRIELLSRDGQNLEFSCEAEETLLDAAARQKITLSSMCGEGSCGACCAICLSGDYHLGEHNPTALPADADELNEFLLCCTTPQSDLRIRVNQDMKTLVAGPIPERDAVVTKLENVGGGVMFLQIHLEASEDGAADADFDAGQYMEITVPGTDKRRAYSIANTPNWDGLVEFYIRLRPNGLFSTWLEQAKIGDRLHVRGPSGSFLLNENSLNPRWFVAGGTGIAPMLSMLRWMAEVGENQSSTLYFSLHDESMLFAQAEMDEIKAALPNLRIEICLSEPQSTWQGFTGRAVNAVARDLEIAVAQNQTPDIYLCGPPGLVDTAKKLALSSGLKSSQVYSERFLAA